MTILLNLFITISQLIGGLLTGSLSLISDAAHNFSDVIALIISWIADKLSRKAYSKNQTFGYKRAEVLAALINVVTIIVIAINIFIEGISRLGSSVEITGVTVILLAILSIVVNGVSVLIIKKDAKNSMNMRSAYLHLFSDMLTSVAVLVGGIIMYSFKIYWIDSVISFVIAGYLIYTSTKLLLETLRVLMQFTPPHIDVDVIKETLETLEPFKNIHHVHIWQLTDDEIFFQSHVTFNDNLKLSEVNIEIKRAKDILTKQFGITHSTFEAELESCENGNLIVDERK